MQTIICKKISPHDTDLMDQIYRLRHQVYVHERNFLSHDDFPEGKEQDAYDPHSVHYAAFDSHGKIIGTMRLILSEFSPTQLDQHRRSLNIGVEHTLFPYAEISRFCISKEYVSRFKAKDLPSRNYFNPIAFSFYKAIIEECDALGIETAFALIERPLAIMLTRCGGKLTLVGEQIDIYGIVNPYKFIIDDQREPVANFYTDLDTVLV